MEREIAALRGRLPAARVAVAVSGGCDSVALLDALCAAGLRPVAALSVHHGLSPEADRWVGLAQQAARRAGVPLLARRVTLRDAERRGTEEAARLARYGALDALCAQAGADVLALAHHLDDVAETVLLQALRGAGPAGLAAMPVLSAPGASPARWRPLLDVPRSLIEAWARARGLSWADDPSNADTRFARNALRHRVLPAVEQHFPAYRRTLARVARQAAQAERLLEEIAAEDLAAVAEPCPGLGPGLGPAVLGSESGQRPGLGPELGPAPGPELGPAPRHGLRSGPALALRRSRWLALSEPRRARVLRAWLARAGLRAPSAARLAQMQQQLERAAGDASMLLVHERRHVRRWRDWIVLEMPPEAATRAEEGEPPDARSAATGRSAAAGGSPAQGEGPRHPEEQAAVALRWRGEARFAVESLGGVLHVERVAEAGAPGLPCERLAELPLMLRRRRGGERIRLSVTGPSRTLKNVFQEHGVPAWQRPRLPIACQDGHLIWVAGVGLDARVSITEGERYTLRWEPAAVPVSAPETLAGVHGDQVEPVPRGL